MSNLMPKIPIQNKYIVRKMNEFDKNDVQKIDEYTQIEYLGDQWKSLTSEEKNNNLVTNNKSFLFFINNFSLVALSKNVVVGFLLAFPLGPNNKILYVHHIAVHPQYFNKNIGTNLYKKLIQEAKENNFNEILAYINPDNPRSINFHKKMKFVVQDWKKAILPLN